jgi:plasmid stabilization system protein ParE
MEVVLLLSAERDLQEAYNWVEEHRQGKEQYFLKDVDLRLEHLKKFPLIGRLYRGRYRRLLIPRYPFGIFYVVELNRIVIMRSSISAKVPKRSKSAFRIENSIKS